MQGPSQKFMIGPYLLSLRLVSHDLQIRAQHSKNYDIYFATYFYDVLPGDAKRYFDSIPQLYKYLVESKDSLKIQGKSLIVDVAVGSTRKCFELPMLEPNQDENQQQQNDREQLKQQVSNLEQRVRQLLEEREQNKQEFRRMKAELASCTCKKGKKFYGDILKVEDNQAKNVQQNDLHPPGSKKKSLFADSDFCCNSYSSFDSKDYKRSISADSEDQQDYFLSLQSSQIAQKMFEPLSMSLYNKEKPKDNLSDKQKQFYKKLKNSLLQKQSHVAFNNFLIGVAGVKEIIIHDFSRVLRLELIRNKIGNEGVTVLTSQPWPALTALLLQHNEISKLEWNSANIDKLLNLYLGDNLLETLPFSIVQLTSLKQISISRNKFDIVPNILLNMNGLKQIWAIQMPKNQLVKAKFQEAGVNVGYA